MRNHHHRRWRPHLMRLEDRTVPSAMKPDSLVDRGDHYFAGNDRVSLLERTDEYVVGLSPGSDIDAVLRSGPFAGMKVSRQIDQGIYMLEGPLAPGPIHAGASWVTPLFQGVESERWLTPTNEIIVALNPGTTADAFFAGDKRFSSHRPLVGTPDQFLATVTAGSGRYLLELANELNADSRLQWAAPNLYQDWQRFYTPSDTIFNQQWHLHNTGQNGSMPDADVDAPEAWNVTPGGSPNVVISIVDDGPEFTHPDLIANLFVNVGEVAGNGVDDDGNGWIDDVNGWDFTSNDNNPGPSVNGDRHGTATAGIAAAVGDNNLGVAGIAYRAQWFAARIFTGGSPTSDANIASALYYSAGRTANGLGTWRAADIVSNSWGGGANSPAINGALSWAGTDGRDGKGAPMFFATGNGGGSSISQPAVQAGTYANVIAVGASNDLNVRSSYSQYGPQIDFLAPSNGGNFGTVTTDRTSTLGYNTASGTAGNYTNTAASAFGGTSSATPLAAGIGALILALDPNLTATQVRGLMRGTTDYINAGAANYSPTTGFVNQYGYGKVNAFTAVSGVGKAEIQVLRGTTDVANNSTVSFVAGVGGNQSVTLRIRNQGTQNLTLGAINPPGGPFSVTSGFGNTNLAAGQFTTFTIQFAPTVGGVQQQNLTFATNDADEGTFTIVLRGQTPTTFVTSSAPNAASPPVSSVTVNFSAPMNQTSFSIVDDVVSFTGPAGNLRQYVSGFNWNTSTQLRIDFAAQLIPGAYSLVLGPQILDLGGLPLDQNQNGVPGEDPGDRYTATFNSGAAGGNSFGYRHAAQTYDPSFNIQPGEPGAVTLTGASNGDDVSAQISLGTNTFRYYGNVYTSGTSVNVSSNGHIAFGSTVPTPITYSNVALTAGNAMAPAAIAALWDDLHTGRATTPDGVVLYEFRSTIGDPTPELLIVNWRNVQYFNPTSGFTGNGISFQAVLQLNTGATPGTVILQYTDLDNGTGVGGSSGQNLGASATIGIKAAGTGAAAADPVQLHFNSSPAVPAAPFAYRIFKNSAPTANANGPYTVPVGGTVALSSAGSSDPDPGDTLTFLWDLDGDGTFGETGAFASRGDEIGAAPTFDAAGLVAGAYPIALRVFDSAGEFAQASTTVDVTGSSPPSVADVVIGDGADTVQRSKITSIVVKFNQLIEYAAGANNAFQVQRIVGGVPTGAPVGISVNTVVVAGKSEATITFNDNLDGTSLADGRYQLTVFGNQVLAGGTPMTADSVTNFHRYYGDANGDANVDGADFVFFVSTYNLATGQSGFLSYLDKDGGGSVDGFDFGFFAARYNVPLP